MKKFFLMSIIIVLSCIGLVIAADTCANDTDSDQDDDACVFNAGTVDCDGDCVTTWDYSDCTGGCDGLFRVCNLSTTNTTNRLVSKDYECIVGSITGCVCSNSSCNPQHGDVADCDCGDCD